MNDTRTGVISGERPSLSSLINSMTEAVVITDMRMNILELNRAAKELLEGQEAGVELNLGDGEWEGSKLDALLHLSTGKSFEFQCSIAGISCLATFTPVINGDEINAVYCQIRKIAGQSAPEETLSAFLGVFREPLFIMDRLGMIADCNTAASSLAASIGFDRCRGIEFLDMVVKSQRITFVEMFKRCQAEGSAQSSVIELSGPEGGSAVVDVMMSSVVAHPGNVLFLIGAQQLRGRDDRKGNVHEEEHLGRNVAWIMKELLPFTDRNTYFSILAGKLSETAVADSVIMFDNSGGRITVMAQAACPPALSKRLLSRDCDLHFEKPLILSVKPVIVDEGSPRFDDFRRLYRGYSSALFTPVMMGNEIAGSIALFRRRTEKIGEDDIKFLRDVSSMVGAKLPTFARIEELRHLNLLYERLDNLLARFEIHGKLSTLHSALAREFRMLLSAEESYTFFQRPFTNAVECVASEGRGNRRTAGAILSLEPEFLSSVPETVERAGAGHESLLRKLGHSTTSIAYIIPHSAAYYRGFTVTVSSKGREPGWMELSIAERSRRHVDFILSTAYSSASLERAVHRARLLNLVSETCLSAFDQGERLESLMRYLTDAIPGSDAIACTIHRDRIISSKAHVRTQSPERNHSFSDSLQARIIEASHSRKLAKVECSTSPQGPSASAQSDSNYLLVPAGEHDGTASIIILQIPGTRQLEYEEMEFAEFLSAMAVNFSGITGEARKNAAETVFSSSLSSILAGILSSPAEIPFPAAFCTELGRIVPHDDIVVLAMEGESFARKVFSRSSGMQRGKGTMVSLTEIEAALGSDGMRENDESVLITSLFGNRPGHAIMHHIHDKSGRAAGALIVWRKSPVTFSAYERRIVHSVTLAASVALYRTMW